MRSETREEFFYDMLGVLGQLGYDDAEEVLTVDERTRFEKCDTCAYEVHVLDVQYRMVDGDTRTVTVEGSLSEVLGSLLRA